MADNAIKVLSATADAYRIGGYGVLFGGVDLDGETFTHETDYQLGLVPRKPIYYDHAQRDIKTPLGMAVDVKADDDGIWLEAELDRSRQYVERVMALVHAGRLGWSSGSVSHLAQREGGVIKSWPVVEFSLTPTPAEPRTLGVAEIKSLDDLLSQLKDLMPEAAEDSGGKGEEAAAVVNNQTPLGGKKMAENENVEQVTNQAPPANDAAVLDAIKALTGAVAGLKDEVTAVKAQADRTPANDPGYARPNVVMDTSHWRYDNMSLGDLALAVGTLREARLSNVSRRGVSDAAVKALAMRLESDDRKEDEGFIEALSGMKARMPHIKANEIQQSTLTSYGDEWVGVAYGTEVWRSIRNATPIINLQMQHAVPQPANAESLVFPLEGGDPTWYLVAQAANLSANPGGIPTNTVTASSMGTAQQSRTMAKLGARVLWTGELEEDAFVPFVAQLREQLVMSGAEMLESLIIDGDTATGATTNINDIAGTPAGGEYWLGLNGYRKLALVTNTANSRDGGALDIADFLETIKLMGANGRNAMQKDRLAFILSLPTYWKALELAEVKTRDVNSAATVENGELTRAWGYRIYTTENMHAPAAAAGYELKTNAAGKIDQDTGSNNTKGAILGVRFDQWRPGYRRQMTIETTRIPAADATEIVALMRFGMIYRDTEASAISYNLTV